MLTPATINLLLQKNVFLLLYSKAVDMTTIVALSTVALDQANGTE